MSYNLIWVCSICNQLYSNDELYFLSIADKNYSSSSFIYCKNCWKERYSKHYCQYCKFKYQGFSCFKINKNVCYRCRCSPSCGKCY